MEKRLGIVAVIVIGKQSVQDINALISNFSEIIIARQGIPMPQRSISLISLIVEGPMNQINTLTGKLGRLEGVEVKTLVTKNEQ